MQNQSQNISMTGSPEYILYQKSKPGDGGIRTSIIMQQRENSGSIFRNQKKQKENAPDYTGTARIGDQEYSLSGWINKSRDGKNYLRILFTIRELNNVSKELNSVNSQDDLPF